MTTTNDFLLTEVKTFGSKPANQTLNDKFFDENGYTTAIKRATRDLTTRTLTPKKQADGTLIEALLSKKTPKSFLNQIIRYFADPPKSEEVFDDWHHETCQGVLTCIRKYYTNQNGTEVCYGKAQKIVNMTLKGCYCLQGADQREAYFQHCHMVLDSFTLAWYNRNTTKKVATPWSNLSETEYKQIQYLNRENSVRGIVLHMEPFQDLTPLQREFLIWPLEIMINTVKEVNKCLGGMVQAPYVRNYFAQYQMENDFIMANIILDKDSPAELSHDFIQWLRKIPKNQSGKKEAANYILEKYGIDAE